MNRLTVSARSCSLSLAAALTFLAAACGPAAKPSASAPADPAIQVDCARDATLTVSCQGRCTPLAEQEVNLFCDDGGTPVLSYSAYDEQGDNVEIARQEMTAQEWTTRWADLDALHLLELACENDPTRQQITVSIDGKTLACASPPGGASASWDALRQGFLVAGKATTEMAPPIVPVPPTFSARYTSIGNSKTGALRGTVSLDGDPLIGATVGVVRDGEDRDLNALIDEAGAFDFVDLAPGHYTIAVFYEGESPRFEADVRAGSATVITIGMSTPATH